MNPITMTVPEFLAQFRLDYAEFSDTAKWPDSSITYWLTQAVNMLNPCRWKTQLFVATELFIAHNIVLERMAILGGDVPGLARGMISSEAGNATSVSYDTEASVQKDAGHWNLTVYGLRMARMISFFGAGPMYIGGSFAYVGPSTSAPIFFLNNLNGI